MRIKKKEEKPEYERTDPITLMDTNTFTSIKFHTLQQKA